MKRGVVLTTHLFGLGHLQRSYLLCKELQKSFSIDLIVLGKPVQPPPNFRVINLLISSGSEEGSRIYYTNQDFKSHTRQLCEQLEDSYEFLITEMFPFGTKIGQIPLVEWLIDHLKTKVYCSLREVVNPGQRGDEAVTERLRHFGYDRVFYHSDPEVFRLEESFTESKAIQDKILYTGFLLGEGVPERQREKIILVSCVGRGGAPDLQEALLEAAPEFPDYQFQMIEGSVQSSLPNVKIVPFITHFNEALSASSLAMTQSGSTIWNLYQTKTPALLYPYRGLKPDQEMMLRANRFEEFGLATTIYPGDFLVDKIRAQLEAPYPDLNWDVTGAATTREFLLRG